MRVDSPLRLSHSGSEPEYVSETCPSHMQFLQAVGPNVHRDSFVGLVSNMRAQYGIYNRAWSVYLSYYMYLQVCIHTDNV